MTEQALQLFVEALLFRSVLPQMLVGEIGIAGRGVQGIELVHVALGPVQEVSLLALPAGGEGAVGLRAAVVSGR